LEILIVAPNWLGDAVMALPAIRDVRRHFSAQPLTVAARASVAPVFRAVPGIDSLTILERGKAPPLRGDIAILLPNSFRSAWMLKKAGIKERWGYGTDFRHLLLTKRVARPRKRVSFPEYYSHLVRQLGIETGPLTAKLDLPSATRDAAAKVLEARGWRAGQPLVGIAPGAAFGHAKRWPRRRYAELAVCLKGELGAECVILGRTEDRHAEHLIAGIDLIGQTDLTMLMGVISHCDALVANDSGALHVAAALGIPVAGIYGPTDERYSTPLAPSEDAKDRVVTVSESVFCRPCHLADCPIDHRCMKRISTERVFDIARRFLQELRV
jgi:heptosyltransferase II